MLGTNHNEICQNVFDIIKFVEVKKSDHFLAICHKCLRVISDKTIKM